MFASIASGATYKGHLLPQVPTVKEGIVVRLSETHVCGWKRWIWRFRSKVKIAGGAKPDLKMQEVALERLTPYPSRNDARDNTSKKGGATGRMESRLAVEDTSQRR
jgi:hypothetical protein